jgi:molybdopterin synthase catalytic subunit
MAFQLSLNPIDSAALRTVQLNPAAGAYVSFEGWVRNHHLGRDVIELHYEAYPALAQSTGDEILLNVIREFGLLEASCVHRVGKLVPGDLAVWVGVTAGHRGEAFRACRAIIDRIKAEVPIWKHEFYTDGSSEWVNPADCHCAEHAHHVK